MPVRGCSGSSASREIDNLGFERSKAPEIWSSLQGGSLIGGVRRMYLRVMVSRVWWGLQACLPFIEYTGLHASWGIIGWVRTFRV